MLPSLTDDDPLHVFNRQQLGDSSSENTNWYKLT